MVEKVISTAFDAFTYGIIGCAMAVHRELGPGLRENSYQTLKVTDDLINRQWLFVPDWPNQEKDHG